MEISHSENFKIKRNEENKHDLWDTIKYISNIPIISKCKGEEIKVKGIENLFHENNRRKLSSAWENLDIQIQEAHGPQTNRTRTDTHNYIGLSNCQQFRTKKEFQNLQEKSIKSH